MLNISRVHLFLGRTFAKREGGDVRSSAKTSKKVGVKAVRHRDALVHLIAALRSTNGLFHFAAAVPPPPPPVSIPAERLNPLH